MATRQQQSIRGDILIVDDTIENLRLLSAMLVKEGHHVRQALNGSMALTAVNTLQPDLILLDIMMPDTDGYSVCQQLKADPNTADIPVIFLSALNDAFDLVQGFQVGGVDYITKPFRIEEVLVRIANQLALRAATREIKHLNTQLEARVKERTRQLEIANAQLLDMALHDGLTGLANRMLFMEHLERALNTIKVDPTQQFALLFLDCDRFKSVNDSLGHLVGDELLIAIARRLSAFLNHGHVLARMGGDEFAILLNGSDSITATQIAKQIGELLSHPFQLKRHEVFISASIGIVLGHPNCDKPEHLLRNADIAMYSAKASGHSNCQMFDPVMHEAALQRLALETDLHRAIQQEEFVLHYQPIVVLETGTITGFEALIRWQHPQRGLLFPGTFIPIAEEIGLIHVVSNWVLRQACGQLQQWQAQGLIAETVTISVNLAAQQFSQPNLIESIDQILAETGLAPDRLTLELTESALMDNTKTATMMLQKLRERHIRLSIDDFGTGYSSLSYLHSFPVDALKIDRSFIQRIGDPSDTLSLVKLIIDIARSMNMVVIAEGIETQQQRAQLQALRCDLGQGYLFSRPIAPHQVAQLCPVAS